MKQDTHAKTRRREVRWWRKWIYWAEVGLFVTVFLTLLTVIIVGAMSMYLVESWHDCLFVLRDSLRAKLL